MILISYPYTFQDFFEKSIYEDICTSISKQELYESQGIDENVLKTAKDIINKIQNNSKEYEFTNQYGIPCISSEITTNINNYPLTVNYTFMMFDSISNYLYYARKEDVKISFQTDVKNNGIIITMTTFLIDGIMYSKFFDEPLHHEITHAYELTHKNLNIFNNSITAEEYDHICEIVNNKESKYTKKEVLVAKCAYYCYKFEKHAFLHGLYAYLVQDTTSSFGNLYAKFVNTQQYKILQNLSTIIQYGDMYENEIKTVLHITPEKFLKYVKKRYNEYISGIGKILNRIYQYNLNITNKTSFSRKDFIQSIKKL